MRRGSFYVRVVWRKSYESSMRRLAFYALLTASSALGGPAHERVGMARAIDGDTIVMGSEKIRLRHIDAPELTQACRLSDGRMLRAGRAARNALRRAISGRLIRCIIVGRDRYQRAIGYCINEEGINIERHVLSTGFAVLRTGVDVPEWVRVSRVAQRSRRGIFACERASDGRIHFFEDGGGR